MLLFNVRRSSEGFTLIETLTILVLIGILSALAAPSFLGLLNRTKVNNALVKLQGALQEAQREAVRQSRNCTVIVPAGSNVTLTSPTEDTNGNGVLDLTPTSEDINSNGQLDTNNCLVTGDRTLTDINIRRDATLGTITFNFKGQTTTGGSDTQAIVISLANDTSIQERCLMISNPLGMIKTGIYNDSQRNRTTVAPTNPNTDPNCAISRYNEF
jgi:Tfp pilus assembly protein FimT